jgi:group I intron endonuclease
MNCGIYKIENLVNGDFYLGGSSDLLHRRHNHFSQLKKNISHHPLLQKAFDKFGAENFKFKIILYCEKSELIYYEQKLMDLWKPVYNVCKDFVNSRKNVVATDETRTKISKNHADLSGKNHPFYGKKLSLEHIKNRQESRNRNRLLGLEELKCK